jgi:hypothetical protein
MDIHAEIKGIRYIPYLCKKLNVYDINCINSKTLYKDATFVLNVNNNEIAVSWWVSPKRTRSYPYARVYDSLAFSGKKVTIIPLVKDEGSDGDRDFLQWDTISLMSLLGIYVIIAYYVDASKRLRYNDKITDQLFDIDYIKDKIRELLNYQSDALHWNLSQLDNISIIGKKALEAYDSISKRLGVKLHSRKYAEERIKKLSENKESFIKLSRELAEKAQKREAVTIQPKENLKGRKATLTIRNYLGGYYYFTCDEVKIEDDRVYLIEGKHTKTASLPSLEDIKDGLLKMILYSNLENISIDNRSYQHIPILKLTTNKKVSKESLIRYDVIKQLINEARTNGFKIMYNEFFLV